LDTKTIIPAQYLEQLAITAKPIDSIDLCQLTELFNLWLKQAFDQEQIIDLVTARAQFVDCLLAKLWCQHQLDEEQLSLIAVGGYGRKELHPYSDVDILVLTQAQTTILTEQKISAFITQLWDVKLDIGSSVRSVQECLKQAIKDITVATSLMEMRPICGDPALPAQLIPLLNEDVFWTSSKFFIAKREEQSQRHQQYHGAAYTLEPNLKSNPGALRDIQTIAWVAKRHFKADSLEQLVTDDYLTRNEYFELLECQDFLWRMRFALHFVAGRNENRLLFDYQGDVAKLMGFGDQGKIVVERMMNRFFRIIGRVAELNNMLLQHFDQAILQTTSAISLTTIDRDFLLVDNFIKTTNDRVFMRSVNIMKMFLIIAQRPEIKGIHSATVRTMRNARRRLVSGLQDYAQCRQSFMALIRHPRGLGLAFTLLHRHSILGAYLPLWRNIAGQMQFDLFHAYSVDEHSFRLIKNLHRFSQNEHNHEYPLCSKIVQRIRKPEVLYLAGIFHDIAKGRGGNHAELGAIDALQFCQSHQLNDHDGRMVAWLVKYHLLMSITAQRRDISDEIVIAKFCEIVRDEAHLDYLYCLTVADMRATNESLWNSWKANLLEQLYFATKRAFLHGLQKPVDLRGKIRENQQQAIELLHSANIDLDALRILWRDFKADYFLRYSPMQIAWHSTHMLEHDIEQPLVMINAEPYRGGTEVFVYTKQRASIFATTVALLGSKKLSIHDAKIITSKAGFTLNTFVVLDKRGRPITDVYRAKEITKALCKMLSRKILLDIKAQPISKRFKQFKIPTQVNFITTGKQNTTLLEIVAVDRPGLLASFAQVFKDCRINIHSAKITTFGEKADDVFTISNSDSMALTQLQQHELNNRLCDGISS
jgi:[protein-PII] uridylyltransferase